MYKRPVRIFEIIGHRTAPTSIHFITKSGAANPQGKAQDANDLRRHLIDFDSVSHRR